MSIILILLSFYLGGACAVSFCVDRGHHWGDVVIGVIPWPLSIYATMRDNNR